ncbi:NAC domain-containing protein 53 isoform X1 [Prunus avium]|uniref:NAC domain-containing protein 53 isoform X1 n=1 Tax=Prunus avium TaxID=42229 RepID=A0A6P5SXH5_PRUAV|nr:NAC domain-containing protein 53 isoform X1 [Prunus avium]XP_021818818.1 NAC domain-containing protein 53 isoform X1 [Prunus avium]
MGRNSLAPGFRFHPTDEELVWYYLKRKVSGKNFRFDPISVIDIYKTEPWDLPGKSKLKTGDLEWYFFSFLDKKYGNSSRTNRATEKGYWKTTGKDRPVLHNSRNVGMKKTLVFHSGRAPKGARTNWVMHEYRLSNEELEKSGIQQKDPYVLCRIFQKSGTGPKNGEQYGAPIAEEEWDDDDVTCVPGELAADNVVVVSGGPNVETNDVSNGAYVEAFDNDQNFDTGIPSECPPLNFYYGETSNYVEHSVEFVDDVTTAVIGSGETSEYCEDQKFFDLPVDYEMGGKPVKDEYLTSENCDDLKYFDVPEHYETDAKLVKDECFIEPSNDTNPADVNYPLNEPYFNPTENPPVGDGLFLETNDLSNPVESTAGFDMLDEYLTYFDADDDISQYIDFDSCGMMGVENSVPDQSPVDQKQLVNGETEQLPMGVEHLAQAEDTNDASSSKQKPEFKLESDVNYPFIKKASHMMLGNIPAPPAFASEFPAKDAIVRLNSGAASSSSVHVTAGMIRIRDITSSDNRMDWSFGKDGVVNLVFSVQLSQNDGNSGNLVPMDGSLSGKTGCVVMRGWFLFMFFWVLFLSMSFKIGSYVYTR